MVTKKQLEILLQKCRDYAKPKAGLEQYPTPAKIVAEILNFAYLKGDVKDKAVLDLGCGTGRFAIGASLLEAKLACGFDVDEGALEIARENAAMLKANTLFERADIADAAGFREKLRERFALGKCNTVFQNPPFGVKRKGADRKFLEAALGVADITYTMHKAETREFIKKYVEKLKGRILESIEFEFEIPYMYSFHKKEVKRIKVDLYRIESKMVKSGYGRKK